MGTLLDITLYSSSEKLAKDSLNYSFKIAQDLDVLLSNYKETSELSALNQNATTASVHVSKELFEFLELCRKLSFETDGYFDPTISPVFKLWNNNKKPSESQISKALELTGISKLNFLPDRRISFARPDMAIDSGGIGKGYAVDKIADYLKSKGINQALINFGHSSIYALGSPPEMDSWKLKIEFPDGSNSIKEIYLVDKAFTSSFAYAVSKSDSTKLSAHIIDPHNGYPLNKNIKSMAISQSASLGEALSKYALFVPCDRQKKHFFEEKPVITRVLEERVEEC